MKKEFFKIKMNTVIVKINKISKSLVRLIRTKIERQEITNIWNKKWGITTDSIDIKEAVRKYYV